MLRLLALLAVGLSGYLGVVSLQQGQALGCSFASFECDAVLATGWSKVLGVPVAFLGAGCYLGLFVASWLAESEDRQIARWGISLMILFTTSALVAGGWFTGLQFAKLGTFCLYCLGVHLCGLLAATVLFLAVVLALRRAHRTPQDMNRMKGPSAVPMVGRPRFSHDAAVVPSIPQILLPVALGMFGGGVMIGGQLLFSEPTHEIVQADSLVGDFDLTLPVADTNAADDIIPQSVENGSTEQAHVVLRPSSDNPQQMNPDAILPKLDEERAGDWSGDDGHSDARKKQAPSEPRESVAGLNSGGRRSMAQETEVKPSRMVELVNGRLKIDVYKHAYVASPEAPHVVVELFDYTCNHCRKLNADLRKIGRRYDDQIVVVVMPVPLEKRCNPSVRTARPQNRGSCKLAKLAMCAASINPARFGAFHDWLMDNEDRSRRYEEGLLRAYDQFGRDNIRDNINSPELAKRLRQHINLFTNLSNSWQGDKKFGLPVLLAGNELSAGTFDSKTELYEFLETSLGVEPVR